MNKKSVTLVLLAGVCGAVARPGPGKMEIVVKAVAPWFAADGPDISKFPPVFEQLGDLSKEQTKILAPAIWEGYTMSPLAATLLEAIPAPDDLSRKGATPTRHDLALGEKVMPFHFFGTGLPKSNRPLFIALHGGGSAGGGAQGPHAWPMNTSEWETQTQLARSVYPDGALYFVPRMADDNEGRWYYSYCQDAYDKVVRAAILHHNVNPNRVYLIGISEGAYTAYRLGAFMADRWAGAGSMAGGEPAENAPPENMRNLAFRADIGELDTMFDRVGLNRRYGELLNDLRKTDMQGFVYKINVQSGRGHGIDYKPCPEWLVKYERDPWPKRVVWQVINVHGRYKPQFYWLALDREPNSRIFIDARIDKGRQTVEIIVEKIVEDGTHIPTSEVALRVYLNDELLNLDRPVRIVRNGEEIFNGRVVRSGMVMLKSLAERGDPAYMFPTEVAVAAAP